MKKALHVFARCVWIENIVMYCIFMLAEMFAHRTLFANLARDVAASSWSLLLPCFIFLCFVDRRAAVKSFIVIVVGLIFVLRLPAI